jgi:hypothetical protein
VSGDNTPSVQVNTAAVNDAFDVRTVVSMARLEAKLDVAIAHQGATIATHDVQIGDHESRLREVERRPAVTPKGMWTAALGAVGAVAALVSSGILPIR